jgi:hypothetical protein
MAKEILAVPEEHLADVIKIIRAGLEVVAFDRNSVDPEVIEQLTEWCNDEEEYLKNLAEE